MEIEKKGKKKVLRREYEAIAGKISDRQWRRIKANLGISDNAKGRELLSALPLIRAYGVLRVVNGKRKITLDDCCHYQWLAEFSEGVVCRIQGRELVKVIKLLKPTPGDSTIRRWGYELDCPLYLDKWYTPDETQLWIRKIATHQVRFKLPTDKKELTTNGNTKTPAL